MPDSLSDVHDDPSSARNGATIKTGDGTAIFTNDGGAARRFQNEVEVCMVGINLGFPQNG
ncbi:hypothetical protein [Mycobacterium sp. 141]|uniref:hypothetical protein n=1 Tax=Mycobacterium sp. 141 TaxID=1120797 RepID=UPI0003686AD9|nr:hypothetical protein [Mycobacterium sp. 141]